jgi:hypothetical protein
MVSDGPAEDDRAARCRICNEIGHRLHINRLIDHVDPYRFIRE